MKIYVKDPDSPKFKDLRDFCEKRGITLHPMNGFGRPRIEVDVQKVMNAYRDKGTVRSAARIAGCSYGTAHRIINGIRK